MNNTHTTPAAMEQEDDPKLHDDDAPAPRRPKEFCFVF
jgi:hypothetical protein